MASRTLELLTENGIIAISRGNYGEDLISSVAALRRGGVCAVEVTFEQQRDGSATASAITELRSRFGDSMAVGAGTVMTLDQLRLAFEAGAEYIVSPNTDEAIISETKCLGLVSVPGAMTPTEIAKAFNRGGDIIKIFPAGALGVEYFSAVAAPLSNIRCAAVGGITLDNICEFKRAGACAFGISSSLFNKKLIRDKDFERIEEIAARFVSAAGEA
ncbi:MAG: 2-dehydro-3-deoxyphosphogluconate aldolase [Clostridia bacterium]|nr:2-dehydro-3-deoxyphosphogluconate aldolase [Clostridia bacterium]